MKRGRKKGIKSGPWSAERKERWLKARWGAINADSAPNSGIVESSKEAIASIPETPQAA